MSAAMIGKFCSAAALAIAIPVEAGATPSASTDGSILTEGFQYLDPGVVSYAAPAATSFFYGTLAHYTAVGGGGSLGGGPQPYIELETYAYNIGVQFTEATAEAWSWTEFRIRPLPGFDELPGTAQVPLTVSYGSTVLESTGSVPGAWNLFEQYGVAYFVNDVNWRALSEQGTFASSVYYGNANSLGVYTRAISHATSAYGAGAWVKAEVTASVSVSIDPTWNAAHANGYIVQYVQAPLAVPEPAVNLLMVAGLAGLVMRCRWRTLHRGSRSSPGRRPRFGRHMQHALHLAGIGDAGQVDSASSGMWPQNFQPSRACT